MGAFGGSLRITSNPVLQSEDFALNLEKQPRGPWLRHSYEQLEFSNRADQGFYHASFVLYAPIDYLHIFFQSALMRQLEVVSPNGMVLWEGVISEMVFNQRNVDKRISIKEMNNRVWTRYQVIGSGVLSRSTVAADTTSQAKYGIKEYVINAGEVASSAEALQIAQRILDLTREPKQSIDRLELGKVSTDQFIPSISVYATGYDETMSWQCYNQTVNTGTDAASTVIGIIAAAKIQFASLLNIEPNTTPVALVYDLDRTAGSIAHDIAKLGSPDYRRYLLRWTPGRQLNYIEAAPSELPPVVI